MRCVIDKSPINGREIVIYGAGFDGLKAAEALNKLGCFPAFFVAKDGGSFDFCGKSIPICKPDMLDTSKHFVIVASRLYSHEMSAFLANLEYKEENDYFIWGTYELDELKDSTRIQNMGDYLDWRNDLLNNPNYVSSLDDGFLQLILTNKCNAWCKFCLHTKKPMLRSKNADMSKEALYETYKPLYDKIKCLMLIGGEPLVYENLLDYCNFISDNYPHLSVLIETNGILFSREWSELVANNLMTVKFSVNASNEDAYKKGCWEDAPRGTYQKITQNLRTYIDILRESELEAFAPAVSMVVNEDTVSDVRSFAKYALEERAGRCGFLFDYAENEIFDYYRHSIDGESFKNPVALRSVLFEIMKLERVLAGKFYIQFRTFLPSKEEDLMQAAVNEISIYELKKEYADILQLAEDRSIMLEYEKRNEIRKSRGKKIFTLDEDLSRQLSQIKVLNKSICKNPFKFLLLLSGGNYTYCPWVKFNSPTKTGKETDWDKEYNNFEMRKIRKDMLEGCYDMCMRGCPLNPTYKKSRKK